MQTRTSIACSFEIKKHKAYQLFIRQCDILLCCRFAFTFLFSFRCPIIKFVIVVIRGLGFSFPLGLWKCKKPIKSLFLRCYLISKRNRSKYLPWFACRKTPCRSSIRHASSAHCTTHSFFFPLWLNSAIIFRPKLSVIGNSILKLNRKDQNQNRFIFSSYSNLPANIRSCGHFINFVFQIETFSFEETTQCLFRVLQEQFLIVGGSKWVHR